MTETIVTFIFGSLVTVVTQTIGYLALRKELRSVRVEQDSIVMRLVKVEARR